eukprot:10499563-Alexandrium_andersonii.AAC.1
MRPAFRAWVSAVLALGLVPIPAAIHSLLGCRVACPSCGRHARLTRNGASSGRHDARGARLVRRTWGSHLLA